MTRIAIKITTPAGTGRDVVKRVSVDAEHVETAAAEAIVWIAQRYRGRWQAQLGMVADALGIKQAPVTVPVDEIDQANKRAQAAYVAIRSDSKSIRSVEGARAIVDLIAKTGAFGPATDWYPTSSASRDVVAENARQLEAYEALKRDLRTCASCGGDLTKPWQAGGGHSQECPFTADAPEQSKPIRENRLLTARAVIAARLRKRTGLDANDCSRHAEAIVADLVADGLL